jgi:hypothetical protein
MKKLFQVFQGGKDKRQKKRVELFSNIPAKVEILGISADVKIKDVSYAGFGLIVPQNESLSVVETLEATLQLSNQIFQATVVNKIVLPSQEIKIGLSLPVDLPSGDVNFNAKDSNWDHVKDPETVKNIYGDLAFKGPEAPIQVRQGFSVMTVYPVNITESETLLCEIVQVHQGVFEKGKSKCVFDLFNTCHAFDSNIEKLDQNKIELKLSNTLARLLRRETVRIQKNQSTFDLKIYLHNRELNTSIEEYEVYDYSEHGISMLDPEGNLSLPRNLIFDEVVIEIPNVGKILGKAEIRSYQWNRQLNSYIVGLKFVPDQDPHLTNWHNIVLKARYPTFDFDYKEDDHKKIWTLFESSGYLGLKPRESFNYVYDISKNAWDRLKDSGAEFSKRILIRDGEDIIGHMQFDRIYPSTWCAHALAIDPQKSKMVGKELYSIVADIFSAENAMYTISITETELTWNQKNYYDFVNHYPFPEHNEIKIFQIHEAEMDKPWNLEINERIKIREANKYDLAYILKYFEGNISAIEIKALAYDTDIELKNFNESLNRFGIERKRKFLVATLDDERLGFSVMESGTTGLSIFGIQDTMYVYLNSDLKADATLTYNTLLDASLKYYRDLKIPTVNIYIQEEKREYYSERGIKFVWEGSRWITFSDVSKRYHAHTQILYGHLLLRREKIRKKNKKND